MGAESPVAVSPYAALAADSLVQQDPKMLPLGKQFICLYGKPGKGKSTLASQFPNHIYLDLEGSAVQLPVRRLPDELDVRTWAAFREMVAAWYKHGVPEGVDTLIIDTAYKLYEMCVKQVLADNHWADVSEGDWGAGYRLPNEEFRRVIGLLRKMHTEGRLGTVIVAHEIEVQDDGGAVRKVLPDGYDAGSEKRKSIHEWLASEPSMVLRARVETIHPHELTPFVDEQGRAKPTFMVQARPLDGTEEVKDRSNRLPMFVPASYEALAHYYNRQENKA